MKGKRGGTCPPESSAMSGQHSRGNSKTEFHCGTWSLRTPVVIVDVVFLMLKFLIEVGDRCDKFTCGMLEKQFVQFLQGRKQKGGKVDQCELLAKTKEGRKTCPGFAAAA